MKARLNGRTLCDENPQPVMPWLPHGSPDHVLAFSFISQPPNSIRLMQPEKEMVWGIKIPKARTQRRPKAEVKWSIGFAMLVPSNCDGNFGAEYCQMTLTFCHFGPLWALIVFPRPL